jgi:protein-disulfide isomerase
MRLFASLSGALLLVGAIVCAQSHSATPAKKSALDKAVMEDYVRHLFVWGPQIQVAVGDPKPAPIAGFNEVIVTGTAGGASQEATFYVSKDGQKLIQGNIFEVNSSPFANDLKKIKTDGVPSFGPPAAPIKIVMFSDFECGFCREEAKMLRDNIQSSYPKEVQVFFKDFPLEQIHPWAKPAAIAGRCIYQQKPAAFWDYHDWIYEHQTDIKLDTLKDQVLDFAKTKGLDTGLLGSCMAMKNTEPEVDRSLAEGKSLQVNSTPTLFLNGRRLVGQQQWPQLKQIIDYEIGYQQTHAEKAADKCCEITLPSPLNH